MAGPRTGEPHFPYTGNLPGGYYIPSNVSDPYSGSITLQLEVSSNFPVYTYLFNAAQYYDFRHGSIEGAVYQSESTDTFDTVTLQPDTDYELVICNCDFGPTALVYIDYNQNPVNIFLYSGQPAPTGLADYGVTSSPGGATAYEELDANVTGTADVSAIQAYNATGAKELGVDPDGASLQENVNLMINTTEGSYSYWLQNVASFRTQAMMLDFQDEIWNFSTYNGNLTYPALNGSGDIYQVRDFSNTYLYGTDNFTYSLPLDLQLQIAVTQTSDAVTVAFGYEASGDTNATAGGAVYYDNVTFSGAGAVTSAGILVDGHKMDAMGLLYDNELVFCGEAGGEETTYTQMNATLNLVYQNSTGDSGRPRSVWEFGSDTGETAANLQTTFTEGKFEVGLGNQGFRNNYVLPVPVPMQFSYEAVGGDPSNPPILSYSSGGVPETAPLSTTPTTYYVDNGTAWSVSSASSGNSTDRWATQDSTSGVGKEGTSVSLVYYHQLSETFDYSADGGTGYSAPSVVYSHFGVQTEVASPATVWADFGSEFSYVQSLVGSTSDERWFAPQPNGTTLTAGSVEVAYYHQYRLTVSYSVVDGGTPGSALMTSLFGGVNSTDSLAPDHASSAWFDAGAPWSLSNPLPGSNATERWFTSSPVSGSVTGLVTLSVEYYHQYLVTASYGVVGGGSPGQPVFASVSAGGNVEYSLTAFQTSHWFDSGSTYTLDSSLPGSNATERWAIPDNVTGTLSGPLTLSPTYYQQFLTAVGLSVTGGGNPRTPTIDAWSFGDAVSSSSPSGSFAVWLDADRPWTAADPLGGSTSTERWYSASAVSGNITGPSSIDVVYVHQYFVTVTGTLGAGTVTNATGWQVAGATLSLAATAGNGWRFEGWTGLGAGSYTGTDSPASVQVLSAVSESAQFDPGITIKASGGGYVSFSYSGASGTASGSTTVYPPIGSSLALSATPSSFLYVFSGWSGAGLSGSSPKTSLTTDSPATVMAAFGLNYLLIGAFAAAVLVLALVGLIVLRGRRPTETGEPASPPEPEPEAPTGSMG